MRLDIRDGRNAISESTVSNTELCEFFGFRRVHLSEFLSALYPYVKANSQSFSRRAHRVLPRTQRVLSFESLPSRESKQYHAHVLQQEIILGLLMIGHKVPENPETLSSSIHYF